MKFKMKMLWDKLSDRFSLFILAFVLLYGFFGKFLPFDFNSNSASNWEDASITTTFIFTILLYIKGYFSGKEKLFEGFKVWKQGVIPILVLIVVISIIILIYNMFNGHKLDRRLNMLILFLITIILCWIDYQIGQNNNIKEVISRRYHTIFYISDLPITVTLGFLLLYSVIIKILAVENMDTFFSGAIAFQLLISLLLWSFADNIALKIVNNNRNNQKKGDILCHSVGSTKKC